MERECTRKCRSVQHGNGVTSALSKGNELDALAYIRHLCCNVSRILDGVGRNALHVAAACGKTKIVEWLLQHDADANVKDGESGWTALHRSVFYGQLVAAKLLILHGCSLQCMDYDGHTPLDLAMKDRLPYIEYLLSNPCDAYVWGANTNFNLGLESQQSRSTPELIDNFKRENVAIRQVVMRKFHTVFLSSDGKVFTCGHGHGGRLGHGNEQTSLVPKQVKALSGEECIQVAAGVDHTVILTSKGAVWSCGLNNCHQLGHNPAPERQLSPKPIKFFHQKGVNITGICAARYHTIAYSKDGVYSFGLNAGHLGHLKGERTEINPQLVSALNLQNTGIDGVVASDGATICWTNKGDVYVLHEYQCRKIASKQMNILNIVSIGGHLDSKCNSTLLKEQGGFELKILLLTKFGKVFLWTESNPHLTRCLFSLPRQLCVSSLVLNYTSVGIISDKGEGFVGHFSTKHIPSIKPKSGDGSIQEKKGKELHSLDLSAIENVHSRKPPTAGFVDFLNKDECYLIRVERLHAIHRGVFITSDPKGKNFAVLQSYPTFGMLESLELGESEFINHFEVLFEEASVYDLVYDFTFKVANVTFPAHKYILASNSEYCRKLLKEMEGRDKPEIKLENIHPEIFRHILQFIYTQKCDFLKIGYHFNHLEKCLDKNVAKNGPLSSASCKKSNKKSDKDDKTSSLNPVKLIQEAAKRFGLKMLVKRLETLKHSNGKVTAVAGNSGMLKYCRKRFPEFYDVIIETEDKQKLLCHKCVLVARAEYFHSMFASNWIESVGSSILHLPVAHDILEVVLDYLYADEVTNMDKLADVDFAGRVLIVADQLLLKRLKTICESTLANLITLKNAAELMQFSFTYQAEQLQNICMEFICINLPAILETKNLAIISDDAMVVLTKRYREMIMEMQYRHITPYEVGPTVEEIESVASMYPNVSDEPELTSSRNEITTSTKKHKSKRKGRIRRDSEIELSFTSKHESIESSECHSDLEQHLTSPSPEPLSDSSITEDKIKSMPIDIPLKVKDRTYMSFNFSPTQLKMDNGAWNSCSKGMNSFNLKDIMCQQQQVELKQISKAAVKTSNLKKASKLSQKQRKKLTAVGSPTDQFSPQMSPTDNMHSPNFNVWGNVGNGVHSLKEIMNDQLSNSMDNLKLSSTPPLDVMPLTESTMGENPWHCKKADNVPKFVDILLDEQSHKPTPQPKTKPLHLIQMEQQAIEELEQFYRADSNPDERVTVMRILPTTTQPPLWKGRPKTSC